MIYYNILVLCYTLSNGPSKLRELWICLGRKWTRYSPKQCKSRGLDPNLLSQITPGAPSAPERGVPQAPVGAGTSATPQRPSQHGMGTPPTAAESEIIVKSLDSRLKMLGKLQEAGFQV